MVFSGWHNIGKAKGVKKEISYRDITVIIGVVVAAIIAITLWIQNPDTSASGETKARPAIALPTLHKSLVKLSF